MSKLIPWSTLPVCCYTGLFWFYHRSPMRPALSAAAETWSEPCDIRVGFP